MKKIKYIILCLIIITTTRGDIQAIEKENNYIFCRCSFAGGMR